jgi:1,4-alpha-glucan branching enzyme
MTAVALASSWRLDHPRAQALADAILGDPFAVLGPHKTPQGWVVRAFLPAAARVQVVGRPDGQVLGTLDRGATDGLFEGLVDDFKPYRLRISWTNSVQESEDPYSFGLLLGDMDLHLFNEGRHFALADSLGAQVRTIDGVPGVRPCGRPMRSGSPSSAISTPGTPAGIPCECVFPPASGNCSCRVLKRESVTNSISSDRTATAFR